jgi:hypothetical protein
MAHMDLPGVQTASAERWVERFLGRNCPGQLASDFPLSRRREALGVTRNTLSELVNAKRGISPEMAVRLSKVFGGSEQAGLCNRRSTTLHKYGATA